MPSTSTPPSPPAPSSSAWLGPRTLSTYAAPSRRASIARRQLGLDLEPAPTKDTTKPRQVILYVHLSEAAITGVGAAGELAQVHNHHRTVLAEQVKAWCSASDTGWSSSR